MKKIILFSLLFSLLAIYGKAQNIEADNGKTYYDKAKTKPKEVFSFKEVTRFDPNNPSAKPTVSRIKHGPYFYYFENGKLKVSGQYKDEQKHGEWKTYDEHGILIKTEKYENDKLVN